jgi:MOSC domain-containing protein YiiM
MQEQAAGTLLAIAVKDVSRGPIQNLDQVNVSVKDGIDGDYHGRTRSRQVTVLSREAWEQVCLELGVDLPWTARRSNLLVDGVDLEDSTRRRLHIGELVLEVTGMNAPCFRMDEASQGLRKALRPNWRGGVTCKVIEGSTIAVGAPVRLE